MAVDEFGAVDQRPGDVHQMLAPRLGFEAGGADIIFEDFKFVGGGEAGEDGEVEVGGDDPGLAGRGAQGAEAGALFELALDD